MTAATWRRLWLPGGGGIWRQGGRWSAHRADLEAVYADKGVPVALCSPVSKALLISLILAYAGFGGRDRLCAGSFAGWSRRIWMRGGARAL